MEISFYGPLLRNVDWNMSSSQYENEFNETSATEEGFIAYSIVTPIICVLGIVGNTLSLIVLSRRELKGSIYVYLTVLSFVDLCGSILLCLSGFTSGLQFSDFKWAIYDAFLGLPLSIILNTMSVFTTIMVTFDRLSYLAKPLRKKKPKWCHACIARRIMVICCLISILTSSPYFFIFAINMDGQVVPRPFYYNSGFYFYNWIRLLLFGLIPSIFLIFGNGYLIFSLCKIKKIYKKCNTRLSNKCPKNYTNLTTTLILIVLIFVISQIPSMLVNPGAASTFFFCDDNSSLVSLEMVREISTVITATSLSSDFVLYYLFCPAFCKILAKMFRRKNNKQKNQLTMMNVFVVEKEVCMNKIVEKELSQFAIQKVCQMVDEDDDASDRDSLASTIYEGSVGEDKTKNQSNRDTIITLVPSMKF